MRKRSDGRYRKSIKDPRTGKTVYFYGDTEREVYKKILEYTAKAERGRTFAEVAGEWWDENEYRWASQSLKPYKAAFNRACKELGDIALPDLTPRNIMALLRGMALEGYSRKTLSNQRSIINQILSHAVITGDVQFNACASVKVPPCLEGKKRNAATSSDEQVIMRSAHVWLFPFIALYTGMRKGEILALQWKDIDFSNNVIRVTKSVYHEGDKPKIKKPKTEESRRVVPLLTPLREELYKRIGSPEEYIISDDGVHPLTERRYTTLLSHFHKATGTTCTAHQIRHSFATIAIAQGINAKTVQEILGHRQISTTLDIYTDLRERSIRIAEDALNAAFSTKNRDEKGQKATDP